MKNKFFDISIGWVGVFLGLSAMTSEASLAAVSSGGNGGGGTPSTAGQNTVYTCPSTVIVRYETQTSASGWKKGAGEFTQTVSTPVASMSSGKVVCSYSVNSVSYGMPSIWKSGAMQCLSPSQVTVKVFPRANQSGWAAAGSQKELNAGSLNRDEVTGNRRDCRYQSTAFGPGSFTLRKPYTQTPKGCSVGSDGKSVVCKR